MLILKYNNGSATTQEKIQVESWYEHLSGGELRLTEDELAKIKKEILAGIKAGVAKKNGNL